MIELHAGSVTIEELLAAPRLLLLKHSPRCGVSRWAVDELEVLQRDDDAAPVAVVDVLAERDLSQQLAARTGVRHESPQLLYLEDGIVRWHLEHGAITADAVRRLFAEAPDRV